MANIYFCDNCGRIEQREHCLHCGTFAGECLAVNGLAGLLGYMIDTCDLHGDDLLFLHPNGLYHRVKNWPWGGYEISYGQWDDNSEPDFDFVFYEFVVKENE